MPDLSAIERQHAEIIAAFKQLHDAVKNNAARPHIYRIIDDLIALTRKHFSEEELLMAQSGYPEIEAHKNMHKELVDEAQHLREKFDYVEDEKFMAWLNHWPFGRVLAHIQYADKQLKDQINQPG